MNARGLLTLLIAVGSVAAYAQAEDARLRRELQAYYAQMDRYAAQGNCEAALRMMDPGIVWVDTQGKRMGYKDIKAMMNSMRGTVKDMRARTSVKHVQRQGNEAVAWIEMKASYKVRSGARWKALTSTHRYAETLKRTPGGWKGTYVQELPMNEPWGFGG